MRDVARPAVLVGDGQRLHQLPAGEVGDADIAHLAGAHQIVERRQHLLDRRAGVEGVQLQQVDIVGAEPPQRVVHRLDQARARGADIVRPVAHRQRGLGRDQHRVAPALDRLAEHLFRRAVRIDVGGVEEVDAGFEADVDQPPRLLWRRWCPKALKSGPEPPKVPAPKLRAQALSGRMRRDVDIP